MPDNLKDIAQALPFMLPAAGALSMEGGQVINKTRVVEAVIIAAFVGLLSIGGAWFLLIPELKTEFKYIARDMQALSSDMNHVEKRVDALSIEVVRDRFTRTDFEEWRNRHGD